MLIDEVMTRYPDSVRLGSTVRRAAELLAASGVGMLTVLDDQDRFVGVLTETDLLEAVLPDAAEIAAAGNTMDDAFDAFLAKGRARAEDLVDELVVREPVTVARGIQVAAAAVVLLERGLRRIPVVEGRRVVGTVSRTDLCRAVLAHAEPASATTASGSGSGSGGAARHSRRTGGVTSQPLTEESAAKVAAAQAAATRATAAAEAAAATAAAATSAARTTAPGSTAARPTAAAASAPRTPAPADGTRTPTRTTATRAQAARAAAAARAGARRSVGAPVPGRAAESERSGAAAAEAAAARVAAVRARAAATRVGASNGTSGE